MVSKNNVTNYFLLMFLFFSTSKSLLLAKGSPDSSASSRYAVGYQESAMTGSGGFFRFQTSEDTDVQFTLKGKLYKRKLEAKDYLEEQNNSSLNLGMTYRKMLHSSPVNLENLPGISDLLDRVSAGVYTGLSFTYLNTNKIPTSKKDEDMKAGSGSFGIFLDFDMRPIQLGLFGGVHLHYSEAEKYITDDKKGTDTIESLDLGTGVSIAYLIY